MQAKYWPAHRALLIAYTQATKLKMGKISKAASYIKITAYDYLSNDYTRRQLGMPKMTRPRKLKNICRVCEVGFPECQGI